MDQTERRRYFFLGARIEPRAIERNGGEAGREKIPIEKSGIAGEGPAQAVARRPRLLPLEPSAQHVAVALIEAIARPPQIKIGINRGPALPPEIGAAEKKDGRPLSFGNKSERREIFSECKYPVDDIPLLERDLVADAEQTPGDHLRKKLYLKMGRPDIPHHF